jgi:hypothetical protein
MDSGCRTEASLITLGEPQAHDSSGRDDKERVTVLWTVVAGPKRF